VCPGAPHDPISALQHRPFPSLPLIKGSQPHLGIQSEWPLAVLHPGPSCGVASSPANRPGLRLLDIPDCLVWGHHFLFLNQCPPLPVLGAFDLCILIPSAITTYFGVAHLPCLLQWRPSHCNRSISLCIASSFSWCPVG
jgi:hypothetical protein